MVSPRRVRVYAPLILPCTALFMASLLGAAAAAAVMTNGAAQAERSKHAHHATWHAPFASPLPRQGYGSSPGCSLGDDDQHETNAEVAKLLMHLFTTLGGPSWRQSNGWGTSACVSQWYGVLDLGGGQFSLQLPSNNLAGDVGALPPALFELLATWHVDLSDNALSGSLPAFTPPVWDGPDADARTPVTWDLSQNALSGALPLLGNASVSLFAATGGQGLNVSYNQLSGALPGGPSSSLAVEPWLDASHNLFQELYPAGADPSHAAPLAYRLYARNNALAGDATEYLAGWCAGLVGSTSAVGGALHLDLAHNQLVGQLDTAFAACANPGAINPPSLVTLDLSFNRFSSPLPPAAALATGTSVRLSHNQLPGKASVTLTSLKRVDLSFNNFTELEVLTVGSGGNGGGSASLTGNQLTKVTAGPNEGFYGTYVDTLLLDDNHLGDDVWGAFQGSPAEGMCLAGFLSVSTLVLSRNHLTDTAAAAAALYGPCLLTGGAQKHSTTAPQAADVSRNSLSGNLTVPGNCSSVAFEYPAVMVARGNALTDVGVTPPPVPGYGSCGWYQPPTAGGASLFYCDVALNEFDFVDGAVRRHCNVTDGRPTPTLVRTSSRSRSLRGTAVGHDPSASCYTTRGPRAAPVDVDAAARLLDAAMGLGWPAELSDCHTSGVRGRSPPSALCRRSYLALDASLRAARGHKELGPLMLQPMRLLSGELTAADVSAAPTALGIEAALERVGMGAPLLLGDAVGTAAFLVGFISGLLDDVVDVKWIMACAVSVTDSLIAFVSTIAKLAHIVEDFLHGDTSAWHAASTVHSIGGDLVDEGLAVMGVMEHCKKLEEEAADVVEAAVAEAANMGDGAGELWILYHIIEHIQFLYPTIKLAVATCLGHAWGACGFSVGTLLGDIVL